MNGESKMTATTKQTLLQDIGNVLGKVFNVSLAVAAVAEPVVAVGFPGMATIYNLTLTAAAQAEQAAVAAGATQSTTLLKTIAATQAVTPYALAYAQQAGLPAPSVAIVTAYAQAVILSAELFSGITTPAAK
jgi:hypothetical protein